jgi:hypothetical protein
MRSGSSGRGPSATSTAGTSICNSRRTAIGYDTQDLELDIWVPVVGRWQLKDDEVLEQRIGEGRFTVEQVAATRAEAKRITDDFDTGRRWWSDDWARWQPDPTWPTPDFP